MHSMMIQFHSDTPGNELGDMKELLGQLRETEGLIQKTLIASDPHTLGGFYLFTSPETAEAYLAGDWFTDFKSTPGFSSFEVTHFHVDEAASKVLGTPTTPLTAVNG